jgi:hypothetical protein
MNDVSFEISLAILGTALAVLKGNSRSIFQNFNIRSGHPL